MPLQGSFRISKALGNIAQQYSNYNYIAREVLPERMTKTESDQYYIYVNDRRRVGQSLRANGAPANMVTFEMSTSTFFTREHAVKDIVTDRDYDNVDSPPIMLDRDKVEYLTDKLLLEEEYELMQLLFTTTSFSNSRTLTSATSWKYHTTTSSPIQDVLSATTYILKNAGAKANKIVMGIDSRDACKENQNIYSRIQYVQKAMVTEELLASLWDVDKVHVGTAMYNGSKEGQSDDLTKIWGGDDVWIGYMEPNPGIKTKSAAVNFRKSGWGSPFKVKSWREEELDGKMIEVSSFFRGKVISSTSGYIIKTVTL